MTELTDTEVILQKVSVPGGSRVLAFLAYLLGPIGWIIAYVFGRSKPFVKFHIRQSIGLWGGLLLGIVFWVVAGGAILVIPYFGPMLSAASFALVIALSAACFLLWLKGMWNTITGQMRILPLFGERAEYWLGGERRKMKLQTTAYELAAIANLTGTSQD